MLAYPLSTSEDKLSLRALRVPRIVGLAGERKAAEGDTRVDNSRLEDVRVCARKHTRHHCTRRSANSEDAVRVDTPVANGEASSISDAQRVTATVVRERLVGGDVPASAGVRL